MAERSDHLPKAPPLIPTRFDPCRPSRRQLLLLIICVLIVYLLGVTGSWWFSDDTPLYLGLARSLYQGQGYLFNGQFNATVTPGLPLMLAAMHAIVSEQLWIWTLMMTICGLAALVIIYKVLSILDCPIVAFYVVAATALSNVFYLYSHRIMTDAPFTLMFWAMLYLAIRYQWSSWRWLFLVALLTIMCICVRAPGFILLGPTALAFAFDRTANPRLSKRITLALVIALAAALSVAAFYIYARLAVPQQPHYARLMLTHLSHDSAKQFSSFAKGLLEIPITVARVLFSQRGWVFREMGYVAAFLALIGGIALARRGRWLILVLIVTYPLGLIIICGPSGLRQRYIMPIHPLLVYAVIEGLYCSITKLRQWLKKPRNIRLSITTARIVVTLFIACNVSRIARDAFYYSYLSHTSRFYDVIHDGKYAEMSELARKFQASPPQTLIGTLGRDGRALHFLCRRRIIRLGYRRQTTFKDTDAVLQLVNSRSDLQAVVFSTQAQEPSFLHRLDKAMNAADMTIIHRGKHFLAWQMPAAPKSPPPPSQGVSLQ